MLALIIANIILNLLLIFYFRYRDKRNTQLRTIKNLVDTSTMQIKNEFQKRQQQLSDQTINVDISHKKIDQAIHLVEKRLEEMKNYLDEGKKFQTDLSSSIEKGLEYRQELEQIREEIGNLKYMSEEVSRAKEQIDDVEEKVVSIGENLQESRSWFTTELENILNQSQISCENFQQDQLQRVADVNNMQKELDITLHENKDKIKAFRKDVEQKFENLDAYLETQVEQLYKEKDIHDDELSDVYNRVKNQIYDRTNDIKESLSKQFMMQQDNLEEIVDEQRKLIFDTAKRVTKTLSTPNQAFEGFIEAAKNEVYTHSEEIKELVTRFEADSAEITETLKSSKEDVKNLKQNLDEEIHSYEEDLKEKLEDIVNAHIEEVRNQLEEFKPDEEVLDDVRNRLKQLQENIIEDLENKKLKLFNAFEKQDLKIENIENKINNLQDDITNVGDETYTKFKNQLDQKISSHEKEIHILEQHLIDSEKEMNERVQEDTENISKKTSEIEQKYNDLFKKSLSLEKLEDLSQKSERAIDNLEDELQKVQNEKSNINESIIALSEIKNYEKQIGQKLGEIELNKDSTLKIAKDLDKSLQKAKEAQALLEFINGERQKAEDLREHLIDTLALYQEVTENNKTLKEQQDDINHILSTIDEAKNIDQVLEEIQDKMSHMDTQVEKVSTKITNAEKSLDKVLKDQSQVKSAIHQMTDIENMLYHIEGERKKVEGLRNWVAKLQNDLESMAEVDHSALLKKEAPRTNAKTSSNKIDLDDEKTTKNIVRLSKQGWSVEEIADSLHISRTYIELILERYQNIN